MTSEKRKGKFQKLVAKYVKSLKQPNHQIVIVDPFFVMVALLSGE